MAWAGATDRKLADLRALLILLLMWSRWQPERWPGPEEGAVSMIAGGLWPPFFMLPSFALG